MEILQKLADAINSGWRLILVVLSCVLLGGILFVGYRRFFHTSPIMKPPEAQVDKDWKQTDFSNEEALLEYVNLWLNTHAPEVLSRCVPNKVSVKNCVPEVRK